MDNLQHMVYHFRSVAPVYRYVRKTDPEIIEEIITRLPSIHTLLSELSAHFQNIALRTVIQPDTTYVMVPGLDSQG